MLHPRTEPCGSAAARIWSRTPSWPSLYRLGSDAGAGGVKRGCQTRAISFGLCRCARKIFPFSCKCFARSIVKLFPSTSDQIKVSSRPQVRGLVARTDQALMRSAQISGRAEPSPSRPGSSDARPLLAQRAAAETMQPVQWQVQWQVRTCPLPGRRFGECPWQLSTPAVSSRSPSSGAEALVPSASRSLRQKRRAHGVPIASC